MLLPSDSEDEQNYSAGFARVCLRTFLAAGSSAECDVVENDGKALFLLYAVVCVAA